MFVELQSLYLFVVGYRVPKSGRNVVDQLFQLGLLPFHVDVVRLHVLKLVLLKHFGHTLLKVLDFALELRFGRHDFVPDYLRLDCCKLMSDALLKFILEAASLGALVVFVIGACRGWGRDRRRFLGSFNKLEVCILLTAMLT